MGIGRHDWVRRVVRCPSWGSAARYDLRQWTMIVAMAVWLWLNALDLLITYDGVGSGKAYEANCLMMGIIQRPLLAVLVKMSLAYLLLKLVERLEARRPYSGLSPLLAANVYLSWACLHNLYMVSGSRDWSHFLRFFPLAGPPR